MVALASALVAALPGAAVPARAAEVAAAAADSVVTPGTLQFGAMEPGATEVQTAVLTTDASDDVAVVRAAVSGTGELVEHLTTRVEACAVAWTAQGCGAGGVLLLAGPVAPGTDAALDVPVPASGVAYLRVSLTLDGAAPANAASTVAYQLDLLAPDAVVPPVPPDTGSPVPLPTTGVDAAALAAAALALVALGLTLRTWVRERRRAGITRWTP